MEKGRAGSVEEFGRVGSLELSLPLTKIDAGNSYFLNPSCSLIAWEFTFQVSLRYHKTIDLANSIFDADTVLEEPKMASID